MREVGIGPANWPILNKVNYTEWALIMKIKMQARNLLDAIETEDVTLQEDRMALDAITSVVPQEMLALLAVKKSVVVTPRSEKEGTKPPYVCPGCSNHTHGNNMINRCNVIKITSNSSSIMTRGSEKDYIIAAEITKRSAAP
jgi:hypothetical protein